jgi:hypothetical protein
MIEREEMVATEPKYPEPKYQRASDFAQGIGETLDLIQGRDVLLRSYTVSKRPMRGDVKDFVALQVSEMDGDEVKDYHAWSESLAEKIKDIPVNQLPVVIKFVRITTNSGFRIWAFE